MKKTCTHCGEEFIVSSDDAELYKKLDVPPPTRCPQCRLVRKMTWRNERTLYRRKCDLCNKDILSIYAPDKPRKVYCTACWYSDKWTALSYGKDYNFQKPFFAQYKELLESVPFMNLSLTSVENSDYCNYSLYLKNCYLLFGSWECEASCYSQRAVRAKEVFDSLWLTQDELMYESAYCTQCHNLKFSFDAHTCTDSAFLIHCRECTNCFGCINLRNKSYHIFNQPYSKEAYFEKIRSFGLDSHNNLQELKSRFQEFIKSEIRPAHIWKNITHSSGDLLQNCRNCRDCFLSNEGEDSIQCRSVEKNFKDCADIWIGMENVERCYEVIAAGANDQGSKFGATLYQGCSNLQYCYTCVGAHNSFGCASLKQNNYCILNKQYSKEEYEKLIPKIIEHMKEMPYTDARGRTYAYGEFFPSELSPFSYNETIAQEWFPISKNQAAEQGYFWKEEGTKNYRPTILAKDLPDRIADAGDDVINQVIGCEHSGNCTHQCATAFRVIPAEIAFYRKVGLPLPRLCPNCRHYERLMQRNPLQLWSRKCQCAGAASDIGTHKNTAIHFHGTTTCPNVFETSYSPERPEMVYCENCYQSEVA